MSNCKAYKVIFERNDGMYKVLNGSMMVKYKC